MPDALERCRCRFAGNLRADSASHEKPCGTAWHGWFIRCRPGQDVKAASVGQVVHADWLCGFGKRLILGHGDGYMRLYGNNAPCPPRSVREGDAVAPAEAPGGSSEPRRIL
ncbi:MAG: peptidoglycan DD-metalloendopeptidase family protein [Aromatoleum sp.]|nr:peptidoglycan DD-metalloendopeptidase family protein [Aromatoleum sp.]